ncbi:DUF1904 domain-containing protein [Clostridium sp. P21]|uniref:DUF1904 domain-containing protein n=1 Tax=Clostridium muellerianum TaxID=2716538 RepID=A0A7Y0EJD0_9CLOT|nr:DUF1904 domain-containing protein [Clostridium muellerianum]NMM64520.1 DUF1904 domain-containing protein [Clostridium muellerianum]
MPQIKIRGIQKEKILPISTELITQLKNIIGCPENYFTIEHIPSSFIKNGSLTEGYPFIEVAWFDRGQEIQDKVAECITTFIHNIGCNDVDIFFTVFKENCYYENGKHF